MRPSLIPTYRNPWVRAGAGTGAGKSRSQILVVQSPTRFLCPFAPEGHLASYYTTLVAPSCVCVQHQTNYRLRDRYIAPTLSWDRTLTIHGQNYTRSFRLHRTPCGLLAYVG